MYDFEQACELAKLNASRLKWFIDDDATFQEALAYCEKHFEKPICAVEKAFYDTCLSVELLRAGYKIS